MTVACVLSGEHGRYALSGALHFANARELLASGLRAFAGQSTIEIDLKDLTSADSAGLAVLLAWVERARAHGQRLQLGPLPVQLAAIARVCDIEQMLTAASV
jgi:phospholipid transport system transporter-binding protein